MGWYGANIIIYLEYLDGNQDKYPVEENIVLIKATTGKEAFIEAEKIGRQYELKVTIGAVDKPAKWVYGGVRAIIECQDIDPDTLEQSPNFVPSHGTEVSYASLIVDNKEALTKLINGESVSIILEDATPLNSEEITDILDQFAENNKTIN
jgi:hypothetical protein